MLGVIIVTYNSSDVITACLERLVASNGVDLRIVVCDNASQDDTVETIRAWARDRTDGLVELTEVDDMTTEPQVALLRAPVNRGFAAGVNMGLRYLMRDSRCGLFWILNPDCEVAPDTATAFLHCAAATGDFALMGSRVVYLEPPGLIQSEGGRVERWTGICRSVNRGADPAETERHPTAADLDFIPGASMVATRRFVETAGPMAEDYFLYYEEVDWAACRGTLALVLCENATVYHHGGTSIGTGAVNRLPTPFSLYFNNRNRMRFLRKHRPIALPTAYLASLARVGKLATIGAWPEAQSAFLGLHQLPPPKRVRERLSPEAADVAFNTWREQTAWSSDLG